MNLGDANELQTTAMTMLPWSSAVLSHNMTGPDSQDSQIVQSDAAFQQWNLTENEPLLQHTSNTESGYTTLQSANSESFNLYGPTGNTVMQHPPTHSNSFENLLQNESERIDQNRISTTCLDSLEGQSLANSSVVEDFSGEDWQGASLTASSESFDNENQASQALNQSMSEPPIDHEDDDFRKCSRHLSVTPMLSSDNSTFELRSGNIKKSFGGNEDGVGADEHWKTESSLPSLSTSERQHEGGSNRESGYSTLQAEDAFTFPSSEPIGFTALECLPKDVNSVETLQQTERIEPCIIPTTVLELLEGQSRASDSLSEDNSAESCQGTSLTPGLENFDNENQGAAALDRSQFATPTDIWHDLLETSTNMSASSMISCDSFLFEFNYFFKLKAGRYKLSAAEDGARAVELWETESTFSVMSTSGMSADDLDFEEPEERFETEERSNPRQIPVETPGEPQYLCKETDVAVEDEFDEFGFDPPQHPSLLYPKPVPSHILPSPEVLNLKTSQGIFQLGLISTGEINGDAMINSLSAQSAEPLAQAAERVEECGPAEVLPQLASFDSVLHGRVSLFEAIQESDQVERADIPLHASSGNADQLPFPQPNDFDVAIDLRRGHDFIYRGICVSCAARPPNFVNLPCQHVTFCDTCRRPGLDCPTCHIPISSYDPCEQ